MYFYTISIKMGGTFTARANSFGEACRNYGVDPMKCQLIKIDNA